MDIESHAEIASIPLQQIQPKNDIIAAVNSTTPAVVNLAAQQVVEKSQIIAKRSTFGTVTVVIALYFTLFIAALDQSIVATSAPTIASSLKSARGYTWISGAYLLANAASGPLWTKLSDIWGRKPLLLGSTAWFLAASVTCAKANSMNMLLAGRALQGAAGGGLIQLSTVTVCDLFSMRRRSLFLGFFEVMWAIAGGAGPILGGLFAQTIGWEWCFWVNLPVCGFTFLGLFFFLDVHNPRTPLMEGMAAIDFWGIFFLLAATLMLLLGLDFGGDAFPWSSPKVFCLIIFGVLTVFVFIFTETKLARYPVMPLHIFKQRSNIAISIVTMCQGMVSMGGEFYLPLYFQATHGLNPFTSGLLVIPLTLMEALCGILTGVTIHQYGSYRQLIWAGTVLMTIGTGLYLDLDASSSTAKMIGYTIIAGAGCGLLFHPPIIAVQALTAQKDVAAATSMLMTVRNIATSSGVVIGGIVFQNSMSQRQSVLAAAGLPANLLAMFTGGDAAANVGAVMDIADPAQQLAVKEAFAWSIAKIWLFYLGVAALSTVASAFVQHKELSEEHTETKTGLLAMNEQDMDGREP